MLLQLGSDANTFPFESSNTCSINHIEKSFLVMT